MVTHAKWKLTKLSNLAIEPLQYGLNASAIPYSSALPRYVRITDITEDGFLSDDDPVSVNDSGVNNYELEAGDILLARTGASVGKSYIHRENHGTYVYAGYCIRLRVNREIAVPYYVFALLHTTEYRRWVKTVSLRSGQPGINSREYSALELSLPSLYEQQQISFALSDVDTLIAAEMQLLKKKRNLREGVAQNLLSGKMRLPGYNSQWSRKELQEALQLCTGTVQVSDIDEKYYIGTENMLKDRGGIVDNPINLTYKSVREYQPEDILISNIRPYLKKIWFSDRFGGCSNDVLVLRSINKADYDPTYLYLVLSRDDFFMYASKNSSGTKMPRGDKEALSHYLFTIPDDIEEQRAIANALITMDHEIADLERKLTKYKLIRQGMMRELLTGHIRLVQE